LIGKATAYDHASKPPDVLVAQIRDLANNVLADNKVAEEDLVGIGVGFAGHLRFKEGVVITSSNFPAGQMKGFAIRDAIQEHFRRPVVVDNDANAQAYGEYCFGAGSGYDTVIFMTISTGVGIGIVLDGRVYRGMTGTAGEFGHTIVEPHSDLQCGCGNCGCLMAHASGLALPQLVRKKREAGIDTSLNIGDDAALESVDGQTLKKGLDAEDPLATAVILDCADYIGIGVYNLFQIFNPHVVVLGGGLTNWGEPFLDRIQEKFHTLAGEMLFDDMTIAVAELGPDAGLIGAAALPLEAGP